jgi:hypothetical protein
MITLTAPTMGALNPATRNVRGVTWRYVGPADDTPGFIAYGTKKGHNR